MPDELARHYRIIASLPNNGDVLNFLEALRNAVNDIRHPISVGEHSKDSIEVRSGVDHVLKSAIDKIRNVQKNVSQRGRALDTDDDSAAQTDRDTAEGDDLI